MRALLLALLVPGFLVAGPPPKALPKAQARQLHAWAPPVIPHDPQGACTDCHGRTREGGTPAIPHRVQGHCQGCHVFQEGKGVWRANPWAEKVSLRRLQAGLRGERAHPQAPPALPHALAMRENCQACHGAEVHPGMRKNPHPERTACLSCHLPLKG